MKKKSLLLTCLVLAMTMLMVLCGCSTYGKIEKAFINDGYTVSEKTETYQKQLLEALNAKSEEDAKAICTIHLLVKTENGTIVNLPTAATFIFEFSSTDEMNEKINDSETLKGLIKDAQNSDYVNGNCIAFPVLNSNAVLEIFKNA